MPCMQFWCGHYVSGLTWRVNVRGGVPNWWGLPTAHTNNTHSRGKKHEQGQNLAWGMRHGSE